MEYLKGNCAMSWDRIEGQWKQWRGKAVHHWGKMMNDELSAISGKYEELVGRLKRSTGLLKKKPTLNLMNSRVVEKLKKSNTKLMQMQSALNKQKNSDRKDVKSKSPIKKRIRSKAKGRANARRVRQG
jgi:uncharacterized protein YjbJ (UPF0337 family)